MRESAGSTENHQREHLLVVEVELVCENDVEVVVRQQVIVERGLADVLDEDSQSLEELNREQFPAGDESDRLGLRRSTATQNTRVCDILRAALSRLLDVSHEEG